MPRADGFSPAQFMFGFQQHFGLPLLNLPTFIDRTSAHARRQELLSDPQRRHFDASAHDLEPFPLHFPVLIQNPKTRRWDIRGSITSILPDGRSYLVTDETGHESKRNRRHLRPDTAF